MVMEAVAAFPISTKVGERHAHSLTRLAIGFPGVSKDTAFNKGVKACCLTTGSPVRQAFRRVTKGSEHPAYIWLQRAS